MELNAEQKQAVNHGSGCCVVTANPGSGKTRVLTSRVIRLINNGIEPSSILCLTFTNKAADEMRERIASQISGSEKIWISTFHKLCVGILRKFGHKIGISPDFTIQIAKDQHDLMKKISRMQERDMKDHEIYTLCHLSNTHREDLKTLDSFRSELEDRYDWKSDIYFSIIEEYLNTLNDYHTVDFSGILSRCHELLVACPEVAKALCKKFQYVSVDEGQDTNIIQYEIIKILSEHNNLFVIGDYAQCIYSFRNANPENLYKIFTDFENVKHIILPKNYRSTGKILQAAQNLIRNNPMSEDVVLEGTKEEGEDVVINSFPTPEYEANFVCEKIKQLVEEKGFSYKDIAVLYRSNSLSKIIEQKCRYYDIDYQIVAGYSFYDRKEIRDALAYLTLVANPHDSTAFHRAVSTPKRGIGNIAIGKIEIRLKRKGD